ncbi:MAG: RloB domain-containing protein, partial [bacterium]|nr:RloB domain-containing protein [bacterium]
MIPTALLKYALKLKETAARNHEEYDQVWCVFDRDSFPPQNYNAAIKLAKQKNIRT